MFSVSRYLDSENRLKKNPSARGFSPKLDLGRIVLKFAIIVTRMVPKINITKVRFISRDCKRCAYCNETCRKSNVLSTKRCFYQNGGQKKSSLLTIEPKSLYGS